MNLLHELARLNSSTATSLGTVIEAEAREGAGTFRLWESQDLLFATIDERVCLLDTGSPVTIGAEDALGELHAEIARYVDEPFDVLLGLDVLGCRALTFDLAAGILAIGPAADARWQPATTASVAGRSLHCLLDTGASITYVPASVLAGSVASDRFDDFFPGFGEFVAETHPCAIELGGVRYSDRVAELPDIARLLPDGIDAIIGNGLLRRHRVCLGPSGVSVSTR